MTKMYGESGVWQCTNCHHIFSPSLLRDYERHGRIMKWTEPKPFFRDLGTYQYPRCPDCGDEMVFCAN
jgi:hypothetical protein